MDVPDHIFKNDRTWTAKWIGAGFLHVNFDAPSRPAPFFRKSFRTEGRIGRAEVFFCGLGWSELYLNGKKVGDGVLTPTVTQYDRRARYMKYDVSGLLREDGENVFGAILGNGWYDCSTREVWHFDKAPWQDYPKLIFELVADRRTLLRSDESWKCLPDAGPIRFNELRNGEFYDSRREIPGWTEPEFDDSEWKNASVVPGPGGILTEQRMPPCRVKKTIPVLRTHPLPGGGTIHDFGQNMTGWVRLKVRGSAGAEIRLRYGERISPLADQLLTDNINPYIKSGETQTDSYTLSGRGETVEIWEPRFTYHGFRYVETTIVSGDAEILSLEGRLVHTDFEPAAEFESSDPLLNKLMECVRWSYVDNFTGIPTDCPHREKNGWTGDALLAAETGLTLFDASSSYLDWLQTAADAQRPDGQLPGIVPTAGWGFNWGSGPAWDSAFLQIPWYVYVYFGDDRIIRENYEAMKRYLEYLETIATDGIVRFGLGDWCHVDLLRIADPALTSTGWYYADAEVMRKCARLLGKEQDELFFSGLAEKIRDTFQRVFYHGDGVYGKGEMTSLACALYQGLCPETERAKTAERLNGLVVNNRFRPDFGILGAKYVPRALAENGYGETAFRLLSQPAYPGWIDWVNRGATTLWETWSGDSSQNHIMFGDVAAWMLRYPGGMVPDEEHPGFSVLNVKPLVPSRGPDFLRASRRTPRGTVAVEWRRTDGKFRMKLHIPSGVPCTAELPDGTKHKITEPETELACLLP